MIKNTKSSAGISVKKRKAFTLAEVLITLGIIGVVAAMTIPSLMTSYKKRMVESRLKQTYSMIAQSTRQYMADEGTSDIVNGSLGITQSAENLKKYWQTYFKIAQDCEGKYAPCFGSKYGKLDSSTDGSLDTYSCNATFLLMNGVAICADTVAQAGSSSLFDGVGVMSVEFDVTGPDGPNIFGADLFVLYVDEFGNVFDKDWDEDGFYPREGWTNGTGAVGKIKADGWKINYSIDGHIKASELQPGPKGKSE